MHYVCLACLKISDEPGICKTEECPLMARTLAECNCTDAQHKSAIPPEEEKGEGEKE